MMEKKRSVTVISLSTIIGILISYVCFADNSREQTAINIIDSSQEFYSRLSDYVADYNMKINKEREEIRSGKIFYKSPDLLKIEYKHTTEDYLILLDGNNYFNEKRMPIKNAMTIEHQNGSRIKKSDSLITVGVYNSEFKKLVYENESQLELELEDINFFFNFFVPGILIRNPLFPFDSFKKHYDLIIIKEDGLNQKNVYVIEGTIKNRKLLNDEYFKLPFKVRCFIDINGFIYKIESFDVDEKQVAFVEYTNEQLNKGLSKDVFIYKISKDAIVIDWSEDYKRLLKK